MPRLFALVSLLVGLGLFLGFGVLAVESALDVQAFPERPDHRTLEELACLRRAPRGMWVRLTGPFELEAGPVQPSSKGPEYMLLRDRARSAYLVVAGDSLDRAGPWSGVPTIHRTGQQGAPYRSVPHGLAFAGVPWASIPDGRIVILWTHSGPENSRLGLLMSPVFALLGLLVTVSALGNLRRRPSTMDAVWTGDALPPSVRLGPRAGRKLRIYAWILLGLGVAWLGAFGSLEIMEGQLRPSSLYLLGVGLVLVLLGVVLWVRARRVSSHDYFAALVWLPVRKSQVMRSEGIATGVTAYELEAPAGAKPSTLTAHSSPLHGGLVFRDETRSEVLAARPLHSTDVLVLSSTLEEVRENQLAPLSHPKHRLRLLP